jgi:hypothetical protein
MKALLILPCVLAASPILLDLIKTLVVVYDLRFEASHHVLFHVRS